MKFFQDKSKCYILITSDTQTEKTAVYLRHKGFDFIFSYKFDENLVLVKEQINGSNIQAIYESFLPQEEESNKKTNRITKIYEVAEKIVNSSKFYLDKVKDHEFKTLKMLGEVLDKNTTELEWFKKKLDCNEDNLLFSVDLADFKDYSTFKDSTNCIVM